MSRNFISINDVSDGELEQLTRPPFDNAAPLVPITGTMAFLFEQVSVRTMSSFAAAGVSLGLTPIPLTFRGHAVRDRVDVNDEVTQLSLIARCVVVRSEGALVRMASSRGGAAIVNAGDGSNEHPSQALLDIATMRTFGPLQGKRVALMGNLHHRVHHSLLMALERFGVKAKLISTAQMAMDPKYTSSKTEVMIAHTPREVEDALAEADYIYQTPVAHWNTQGEAADLQAYTLNRARAERVLKPEARILHPFPRLGELDTDLDGTKFDAYHPQTSLGPAVRRRLLELLLCGVSRDAPAAQKRHRRPASARPL